MKLLAHKRALVTGGSKGIGKKIVEVFVENGADVAFTFNTSGDKARVLESQLTASGGKVKAYFADASSYQQAEQLMSSVLGDFGSIDIIVNNAGITRDGLLIRMSEKDWDDVISTNLKSVFNLTKAACKMLMKQRHGSIIHLSSVVGVKGNAGQANYSASKAGIIGFSKSCALELGSRNIRSNVIAPGLIRTEMTEELPVATVEEWLKNVPMKRMGSTDDVANAALFLASDLSTYINGQVLSVCGGLST